MNRAQKNAAFSPAFSCSSKIARSAWEDVTYPASMFSSINAAVRFLGLALLLSVSCCGDTTFVVIVAVDFFPFNIGVCKVRSSGKSNFGDTSCAECRLVSELASRGQCESFEDCNGSNLEFLTAPSAKDVEGEFAGFGAETSTRPSGADKILASYAPRSASCMRLFQYSLSSSFGLQQSIEKEDPIEQLVPAVGQAVSRLLTCCRPHAASSQQASSTIGDLYKEFRNEGVRNL